MNELLPQLVTTQVAVKPILFYPFRVHSRHSRIRLSRYEKAKLVEIILARAGKYAPQTYQQVMASWHQAINLWLE